MRIFTIFLLIISITAISFSQSASKKISEHFPLKKGNYWVYKAKALWKEQPEYELHPNDDNNPNRNAIVPGAAAETFTWKVEVTETFKNKDNNIEVAILTNDFDNLSYDLSSKTIEGKNQDKPTAIISINDKYIYSLSDERVDTVIERAKRGNFSFSDLISKDDLILLLPLKTNTYFGRSQEDKTGNELRNKVGAGSFKKGNEPGWCWNINKQNPISLSNISFLSESPILDLSHPIKQYELSWGANNGFIVKKFVSGVGFTGYRHLHHGPSFYEEFNLELVECNLAK